MKKILKNPRKLCNGMMGQNYWFNGCMDYLMECLGESREYNYWFFSDITGDSFTQIFSKNPYLSTLCLTDQLLPSVIDKAFDACGYTYEHITGISADNRFDYYGRIRVSIDKEVPVIVKIKLTGCFDSYGVICGYDNDNFYYLIGEDEQPQIYPERFFQLIFVEEKKDCPSLAEVYHRTVLDIPAMLTRPATKDFSFGRQAFTDWAESFQNGMFDKISLDDEVWYTHGGTFNCWNMHGNYLCMLGTNACAENCLHHALEMNPDMRFIERLLPLFQKHNGNGFGALISMENGFSLSPKALKDKDRMKPVSDQILETGKVLDEILDVFQNINHEK